MKSFFTKSMLAAALISVMSFSTFANQESEANCSIYLTSINLSEKQEEILHDKLVEKGYSFTENESEAEYKLEVKSTSRNRFNSNWFVFGALKTQKRTLGFIGEDYITVLPLHLLTMGINTLIPTKGGISMRMMLKEFPTCEALKNNPDWN